MNVVELWAGLTGGPLKKILATLERIERNQHTLAAAIDAEFAEIKEQLDRIESDVGGGSQAASLVVEVGTPTEQE